MNMVMKMIKKIKESLFISKLEEVYKKLNTKLINEISLKHKYHREIFNKEIFSK